MSFLYICIRFVMMSFQLLYWYNCPRYLWLRNKVYQEPEVKLQIQPYQTLFTELGRRTGTNITTPEDVFYLDNLFQALVRKFQTNFVVYMYVQYKIFRTKIVLLIAGKCRVSSTNMGPRINASNKGND